jgi:succinate dehydrogenase flavin-adding protein (antitoxin of CptAB toxin-antitoxin module)
LYKVLYEIAAITPALLKSQATSFIELLQDKDNRMQWGAMTALSALTNEIPQLLVENLSLILKIADEGSVITKDHGVRILVSLSGNKKHIETTIPLLLEQILKSPDNQLPSYAEQALPVINGENKNHFRKILEDRLPEVQPESKKKRVEKVLKKLS